MASPRLAIPLASSMLHHDVSHHSPARSVGKVDPFYAFENELENVKPMSAPAYKDVELISWHDDEHVRNVRQRLSGGLGLMQHAKARPGVLRASPKYASPKRTTVNHTTSPEFHRSEAHRSCYELSIGMPEPPAVKRMAMVFEQ